jgi:uncharacterized phage-associated protein
MVSAHDVAAYILEKQGIMTTMKLQKLVYYCQAWSLVWNEDPLFQENIEAWVNGPVVRELYDRHKTAFKVSKWRWGDSSKLSASQRNDIDGVLEFYGDKTSQWLSDLSHREQPWRRARAKMAPDERGNTVITLASMHEYYSSLVEEE